MLQLDLTFSLICYGNISNLQITKEINKLSKDANSLVLNSLNIALIEKALYIKRDNRDCSYMNNDILTNFKQILNNGNLSISTNAFQSMYRSLSKRL